MWGRILARGLHMKRLPPPVEITRPGGEKPKKKNVVSIDQFARMQGR